MNMKNEAESGFFRDDGTRIDPDLIVKPSLCESCRLDGNPDEEVLCILTRADQEDEQEFLCAAFQAKA